MADGAYPRPGTCQPTVTATAFSRRAPLSCSQLDQTPIAQAEGIAASIAPIRAKYKTPSKSNGGTLPLCRIIDALFDPRAVLKSSA